MLNMNERMNESLFNLNYKIISIVRLFNFTRSAILPHNLPKLYSTGRFSWSTICYCAGGRGLKVLNGTRLNDCSMKHYIVLNIALFSHAHVTISAEINLTHACSRGEASRSNCHSRLRAFVGMASRNWETVLKV